jgi:hypothetical protein
MILGQAKGPPEREFYHAHEHNDAVLERNYIGRRFKNDAERLEKLLDLYLKMVAKRATAARRKPA